MRSTTEDAYEQVFEVIKREFPGFQAPRYMGDFDQGMREAVKTVFPGVRVFGCLYHYAQSLVDYASGVKVGLAKEIRRPGLILKKFLAFCALPLLPAEDIVATFEECAEEALLASPRVIRL